MFNFDGEIKTSQVALEASCDVVVRIRGAERGTRKTFTSLLEWLPALSDGSFTLKQHLFLSNAV